MRLKCRLGFHDLEIYWVDKEMKNYSYACPHCGKIHQFRSRDIDIKSFSEYTQITKGGKC